MREVWTSVTNEGVRVVFDPETMEGAAMPIGGGEIKRVKVEFEEEASIEETVGERDEG